MNRIVTWITTNDAHALHFVNERLKCRLFDAVLPKLTHLGGAFATIASLLIVLSVASPPVQMWAIQAIASLTVSHFVVHIVKKKYSRERPYVTHRTITLHANPLKDYSFPSGHTTAAFSIAVLFSLQSLSLAFLLMPLASLIGFSRMYLGLHYPTDCIVGALIGTITSLSIFLLFPS